MAYSQPTKEENGKKEALDVVNKLYYWPPRLPRRSFESWKFQRSKRKSNWDPMFPEERAPVDILLRYSEDRKQIIFIRVPNPRFSYDFYKRQLAHLVGPEFWD